MRVVVFVVLLYLVAIGIPSAAEAQFKVDTVQTGSKPVEDTATWHMTKSPTTAVLLSAIIPGGGQVYLHQWWKVPIIYAGFGSLLYAALLQNSRYIYISDSVNNQTARGDFSKANSYASAREFYRDDRDKYYIYTALIYIANILDAYIAAHLYDFDVSDDRPKTAGTSKYSSGSLMQPEHHLSFNFHLHF